MDTKKLRQKILDLAIRGKLVPQDPNDEPASVLLERIRAEKERLIKEGKIKRSKKVAADDEIEAPFEIPESWEWCNITEITSKITDGTHNSPPNGPNGIYKYVTAKNIKPLGIILDNITYVDEAIHNEIYARCNPEYGDILYIKDGATTGVVTINNLDEPFSLLSSVALIKPFSVISNKFLLYYLQSDICLNSVRSSMKGVGITRITLKQIEQWNVPLPPLAEQKRIANEVERWFTLIDELESNEGDLLKAIDKTKSKILDLAIHGKLVPQDPNDEPAIELLKRILEEKKQLVRDGRLKKKDLEGKPISEDEISYRIPESWEWVRLKSVTSKIVDGDHNPPHGQPNDSGYYMLSSKNIINDSIGKLEDVRFLSYDDWKKCDERTNLTNGDVLLTTVATLGRSCVYENDVPYCFQRSVSVISTFICNYFLKFCFDSPYYQSLIDDKATGTAQRGFYINQLEESIIPIPPLSEQKRIVAKIEELFAVLDSIKESLE